MDSYTKVQIYLFTQYTELRVSTLKWDRKICVIHPLLSNKIYLTNTIASTIVFSSRYIYIQKENTSHVILFTVWLTKV